MKTEGNVQTARLVEIDATAFAEAFARRSIYVDHELVDHPLFTMDAIAELADRLPPDLVRRERGHLPLVNTDGYVDVGEGPPSATILDIERNGFRVSLRDIQQAPEYARADQRVPRRGRCARRASARAGCATAPATCSSPRRPRRRRCTSTSSTASCCRCRGTKNVSVAAFDDDPTLLQRERDRYYRRRRLRLRGHGGRSAETFRIGPGVGVYLPVLRAALGRDGGRDLGLVLDPVLHGVLPSGPRPCTGSTAGCASCTCPRGHPGRRSRVDRIKAAVRPGRGGSSATRGASCRPSASAARR